MLEPSKEVGLPLVHAHRIGTESAGLLRLLLLPASVESGLPLLLLLVWCLVSAHLIEASLILLLHAVEELWLECTAATLRLLLHAKWVRILHIVHLLLLLLLHLHLHELLLFLHSLLRRIKIVHRLERSILGCARGRAVARVHHAQDVVDLVLLVLLHHILLLLLHHVRLLLHHVLLGSSHARWALEIGEAIVLLLLCGSSSDKVSELAVILRSCRC